MGIFNLKPTKWAAFPILFFQFVNTGIYYHYHHPSCYILILTTCVFIGVGIGLLAPTLPDIIVPFFDNSYAAASLAQGIPSMRYS